MYFLWPEEGWHHSGDMLNSEHEWISKSFTQSLLIQDPDHTARWIVGFVYEWCFENPGRFIAYARDGAYDGHRRQCPRRATND
ncbi:DUF4400 domain-containing protein [Pseudomonas sp. MYb541]|uniref:DUF4400 domain-containing protein n=1 Tax=Pseudomonas sp. MYb541 TaxID=2745402 RepID=UPI0030A73F01